MGVLKQQVEQAESAQQQKYGHNNRPRKNKGNQQQGGGTRNNRIVYWFRTAFNFYYHLLDELVLAAILAAPIWIYLRWRGEESVVFPTDFPALLGLFFVMFMLQSSMFKKGG